MPPAIKKIKRPERQRLLILLAAMLIVFVAWLAFSPHGAVRSYQVHRELRAVKEENLRIDTENKALIREIHRLRSDRAYLEEVARRDFGMVRKNEMVFDFSGERKKEKEEE